jgi:hypothetical protein
MPAFTCITLIRDCFHVTQHVASNPEAALRIHVGMLPFDDGVSPFDEELEWLQHIAGGTEQVTMHALGGQCKNTWLWSEGARYDPQYHTYVVQSDVCNA